MFELLSNKVKFNVKIGLRCYHKFIIRLKKQLKIEVKSRESAQNRRLTTYALFTTNSILIYAKKALDFGKFQNEFYENLRN